MAIRVWGHLMRNPGGFLTSRINREVSIWRKKKKKKSREVNVGRDCRFPDFSLPPNRCSPRPLHPLLPSCPSLLFCPLPLRPLLRSRSPDFPAIFSTMNAPDSSNPTAHGDNKARGAQPSPTKTVLSLSQFIRFFCLLLLLFFFSCRLCVSLEYTVVSKSNFLKSYCWVLDIL